MNWSFPLDIFKTLKIVENESKYEKVTTSQSEGEGGGQNIEMENNQIAKRLELIN